MSLISIALLLAQALALAHAGSFKGYDLEALCQNKDVELTAFHQLQRLNDHLMIHGQATCPDVVKDAIVDLQSLIERTQNDLCSVDSIEQVRSYYTKYLDTSKTAEEHEKVPNSLTRFGIAYIMQMSNRCKKNMVEVITREGRQLLASEDFELLAKLISDEGPVADVLGAMGDSPDEVFLPGDLAPFLKKAGLEQKGLGDDKLFMQSATAPYINKIQQVCQQRFRPIYEPLMMPLVRLSNMGFNYKDEPLKCDLQCPAIVREVGQWSRIVFLCESLTGIHLVEDQEDKALAEGTDTKLVRILTKEEAEAIEGAKIANDDRQVIGSAVYTPTSKVTFTEDTIYDKSDKNLRTSVEKFKTSRNEEDIVRKRLVQRGMALAKSEIKKGKIGVVISATYQGMMAKNQGKQVLSPSEQMVQSLNEMVEQQQQQQTGEGAVASMPEYSATFNCLMEATLAIVAFALVTITLFGIIGIASLLG